MDISTTCDLCQHKLVCFARRNIKSFTQDLYNNTVLFHSERDFEDTDKGFESILASNCQYFKREKSKWA